MEPLQRLAAFYHKMEEDPRIRSGPMGLYTALLLQWAAQGCPEPFSISRSQLMKLARIRGKATYHKYLKALVQCGYIVYKPSFDPLRKSLISFH